MCVLPDFPHPRAKVVITAPSRLLPSYQNSIVVKTQREEALTILEIPVVSLIFDEVGLEAEKFKKVERRRRSKTKAGRKKDVGSELSRLEILISSRGCTLSRSN